MKVALVMEWECRGGKGQFVRESAKRLLELRATIVDVASFGDLQVLG